MSDKIKNERPWELSEYEDEVLVIDALNMAICRRKINAGVLFHSGRGSQYASDNFQHLLRNNGIECSMSRKGNCWDNAVAENFFHTLKRSAYTMRSI